MTIEGDNAPDAVAREYLKVQGILWSAVPEEEPVEGSVQKKEVDKE